MSILSSSLRGQNNGTKMGFCPVMVGERWKISVSFPAPSTFFAPAAAAY
jgi:hypothetical protein